LEIPPASFARVDYSKNTGQVLGFLLNAKMDKASSSSAARKAGGRGGEEGGSEEEGELEELTRTAAGTEKSATTAQAQTKEGEAIIPDYSDTAAVILKVGDPIPTEHPLGPYPPRWAVMSKDYRGFQLLDQIKRILAVIPIITKKQLIEFLGLGGKIHQFKEVLLFAAYTFSNGPFSHLWIQYGYDPTQDPYTKIYQQFICKITPKFLNDSSER
jgi:hypothetical protein